MKKIALFPLLPLVWLLSSTALAQKAAPPEEVDANYVFDEDPLTAVNSRERGPLLKVRVLHGRPTLIRPRLHFVAELKKSVENL